MSITGAIDDNDETLPLLRRKQGGAHNENIAAGVPKLIEFSQNTAVVSFWATGTVHLKFGDNTVVASATDHAHPAGAIDYENLRDNTKKIEKTHVSVYAAEDVTFYLSERV